MQPNVSQNDRVCRGTGEVPRWPYFCYLSSDAGWGICKFCGHSIKIGSTIPFHYPEIDKSYIEEINELTKNTIHITGWHGTERPD